VHNVDNEFEGEIFDEFALLSEYSIDLDGEVVKTLF
jgi:hypothetical protein